MAHRKTVDTFTNSPIKKEHRKKVSDAQIEEALRATGGVHRDAAAWLQKNRNITVDRSTITKRILGNPHLQEITREVVADTKDLAESKLLEQINAGNLTAVIFYLKCKAQDRGYCERVDTTISNRDGESLKVSTRDEELERMPINELMALVDVAYNKK